MKEQYIIAYFVLFGVATIIAVIAQHKAPEHWRPTGILKRVVSAITERRKAKSETSRANQAQATAWQARPCQCCGYQGTHHMTFIQQKETTGDTIVTLLIFFLIFVPLTCGFGLLLLPLFLIGGKKIPIQQCPNCGFQRNL